MSLKIILFYAYECLVCTSVCATCVCLVSVGIKRWHQISHNWSYRWLRTSMWVLGAESRSSALAASALNHGTNSPPPTACSFKACSSILCFSVICLEVFEFLLSGRMDGNPPSKSWHRDVPHGAFSWIPLVSSPPGLSWLCCAHDSPGESINFLVEKLWEEIRCF